MSYRTLRDQAFEVAGGAVRKAQRYQAGSDASWTITVQPSGHGDVFHPASRHGQLRRARLPLSGGWRRARKAGYALAMLLAIAMTWSCGSVAPAAVALDPGFLTVEWTGPAAARDSGVLLELEGPDRSRYRRRAGRSRYRSMAPGRLQIVVAGSLQRCQDQPPSRPPPRSSPDATSCYCHQLRENRGTARPCRASRLNTTAPPGKGVATLPGVTRLKRPHIYR